MSSKPPEDLQEENEQSHNESLDESHDQSGHQGSPPSEDLSLLYPPEPQEPLPTDCCGTGCTPCVFDLYDQELHLWRKECERIKHGDTREKNPLTVLSPERYHKFELVKIEKMTTDSSLYTFSIPGDQTLPLSIGQHLVLRWQSKTKNLTRQYTPISAPNTRGKIEFVIKLYPDGEMSQYISTWQTGQMIEWRGPFGNFTYKPNSYKRILMFAAGTGIAPMVQVIQHILNNEDDETWLHLVYACRDYQSVLCKQLLSDCICFWNFSVTYFLSNDSDMDHATKIYNDNVVCSRLTEKHATSQMGEDINDTRVLICGTKSFEKDMINYLTRLGIKEEHYHKF